ncbi:MAG: GntR family transcriptional regulator [Roseateles sp.]|nr:MAG: GntR family transcriptional regulator [Roseateles sp.]
MATASQRLSEQLRETIEEEVATGKLKPGTHLDELELAARFGVSRTPIRETLSLLAGEGLVEIRPRRGAVVAQLSPARLVEMFEVMAELEAMSARLAARRIKDDALAQLEQLHSRCEQAAQAGDPDAYFYANEEFHKAVYRAAQNEYLIEQAFSLQRKLRPYRRLQLRVRNRLPRSLAEHQAVLDAIRANQPEQAAQAMRGHVMVQGDRFADLLVELRSFENTAA